MDSRVRQQQLDSCFRFQEFFKSLGAIYVESLFKALTYHYCARLFCQLGSDWTAEVHRMMGFEFCISAKAFWPLHADSLGLNSVYPQTCRNHKWRKRRYKDGQQQRENMKRPRGRSKDGIRASKSIIQSKHSIEDRKFMVSNLPF